MPELIGFVDYGFDAVTIPRHRAAVCHEALEAWSDSHFPTLQAGLKAHHHEFGVGDDGSLVLNWIDLDTCWPTLELFYKLLAPFVDVGAMVTCADEEGRHLCYRFEHSRIYRIQGRVIYDGERTEL